MDDSLTVTDINYCESTRNVDNMISQFTKDRKKIITMMNKNVTELVETLWSSNSPISYDKKCIYQMGNSFTNKSLDDRINRNTIINEGMTNFYVCPQCKNIRRIFDITKYEIGKPFHLECGSSAGNQLILSEVDIPKLTIVKETPSAAVSRALSNPYIGDEFYKCSGGCNSVVCSIKDYSKINYIGSDTYTNNLLVNWYVVDKLNELNIPNAIKMEIGFVCTYKGYCLYEYPNIGRLRHLQEYPDYLVHDGKPSPTAKEDDKVPISNDTTKGIIMQLVATLHALRDLDFSHGGPSSRSILLHRESCSYLYDGVHVEGPVTIKLTDFHHAGITVGNNRFYNKSVIAEEELLRKDFKPIIETVKVSGFSFDKSPAPQEDITIYRLKNPNKDLQASLLFMYVKHLGLPIYQASFDFYGFMISLMADRSFYVTVMEDESMLLLWRNMWLPNEYDIIQQKMRKLHSSPDPVTRVDKVLRTLSGFGLRCDMIEKGWNMIKKW